MNLPDANLLLYAINTDSPDHEAAWRWWKATLESDTPVGLYSETVFAFVRLATHRRVFAQPLTVEGAFAYLNNWLSFPNVTLVETELSDLKRVESLLESAGTGGNLVSDAQVAAIAIRLNATVYSADTDFGRFPKLKWINPLDG